MLCPTSKSRIADLTTTQRLLSTFLVHLGCIAHWYTRHLHLCLGYLCHLWCPIDLLPRNPTQIPPCDDCRQLWLFVQFPLEIPLLLDFGFGLLVIQQPHGSNSGSMSGRRRLVQHLRTVSLPILSQDPRTHCRRRRQAYRGKDLQRS